MGRTVLTIYKKSSKYKFTFWVGVFIDTSDEDIGFEFLGYVDKKSNIKVTAIRDIKGYMQSVFDMKKVMKIQEKANESIIDVLDLKWSVEEYIENKREKNQKSDIKVKPELDDKIVNDIRMKIENLLYMNKPNKELASVLKETKVIKLPKKIIDKINKYTKK